MMEPSRGDAAKKRKNSMRDVAPVLGGDVLTVVSHCTLVSTAFQVCRLKMLCRQLAAQHK